MPLRGTGTACSASGFEPGLPTQLELYYHILSYLLGAGKELKK